jgi:hypothetical protein
MIRRIALAALASCALSGAALAQQTNQGPFSTTVTAGAAATMAALPANPTRRAATICNGHATQTVTFTTGTLTPISLTTGQTLPAGSLVTSCFTIGNPAGPQGIAGAQINVIASGAATPVTFFEYP